MSATNEPPESVPEPARVPAQSEPPTWATELMTKLDELPGKIVATVTDEDRRTIAEHVHGFFEKSGAFEAGSEPPTPAPTTTEPATAPTTESEPQKGSKLKGFARRFAGEE